MPERLRPLVHIGFHKTASTWLQQCVFVPHRGYAPLGRAGITESLLAVHPLAFDPAVVRGHLVAPPDHRVGVLSMERLSGHPVIGGADAVELGRRVAAVLPQARILVVVREQAAWLRSYWATYVNQGGDKSLREFLRPRARVDTAPGWDPVHLEYDRTIRLYQGLFGVDAVLVAAQEQVRADPARFTRDLDAFAGVPDAPEPDPSPVHTRPRPVVTAGRRAVNTLLVRDRARRNGLAVGSPTTRAAYRLVGTASRVIPRSIDAAVEARWTATVVEAAEGRYEESNARTASLTGLPLARLGYPVAAAAPRPGNGR